MVQRATGSTQLLLRACSARDLNAQPSEWSKVATVQAIVSDHVSKSCTKWDDQTLTKLLEETTESGKICTGSSFFSNSKRNARIANPPRRPAKALVPSHLRRAPRNAPVTQVEVSVEKPRGAKPRGCKTFMIFCEHSPGPLSYYVGIFGGDLQYSVGILRGLYNIPWAFFGGGLQYSVGVLRGLYNIPWAFLGDLQYSVGIRRGLYHILWAFSASQQTKAEKSDIGLNYLLVNDFVRPLYVPLKGCSSITKR